MFKSVRYRYLVAYLITIVSAIDNSNSSSNINSNTNTNNNNDTNLSCYTVKDSLKCPQWKDSYINISWLNTKVNNTKLSLEDKLDQYVSQEAKQYKINTNETHCSFMEERMQQILLPLLCASYLHSPKNEHCYNHFQPICQHECSSVNHQLEVLVQQNENCFQSSTIKSKLLSTFSSLCLESHFSGERGQCLLLSNQSDVSHTWHVDKTVLLGGGLALGLSVILVIIFLILRLRKRRHNRRLKPKFDYNEKNEKDQTDEKQLAYSTFFARRSDEMHLNCGDFIGVWREFDDGWCLGQNLTTQQQGVFPEICLKKPKKGGIQQLIIPPRITSLAVNQEFMLPSQRFFPNHNRNISSDCSGFGVKLTHTRSYSYGHSIKPTDSYGSSIRQAKVSSNFPRINLSAKSIHETLSKSQMMAIYNTKFNGSEHSLNTPPPPVHSPPRPPTEEL